MQPLGILLLATQLTLFLIARIMDDISWYPVNIYNEQNTCEIIAIVFLAVAIVLNFIRKWQIDGILRILLFRSQIKFLIPWSLQILIVILFFNTFTCSHQHLHEGESSILSLQYQSCCLNGAQLILTNFTYSLAVNTKTHVAQLIVYLAVLFAQIIFNGHLLILFVDQLEHAPKDLSLLLISVTIANQILIMDLLFRKAFEDKEIEETEQKLGKQIALVNHDVITTRKMTAGIEMVNFRPNTYDTHKDKY